MGVPEQQEKRRLAAWLKLVLPAAALAGADWTQYLPPGNPHKPTCRRNRGTQDLRSVWSSVPSWVSVLAGV